MNRKAVIILMLMGLIGGGFQARSQDSVPADEVQALDDPQLDQLTGPIALYPDPLVAQILPAATQPSQIAVAYNYISQGGDPNAIDSQPWDSSVKAVAHYPDLLKMMDDDLSWTTQLGDAFVNQPSDVMNSIQRLRAQAQDLGNLESTQQEDVESDDGDIEILPTDPDMFYVPIYDPGLVFFQRSYGRNFISFGAGWRMGAWLDHDFDWHGHNVVVWDRGHPRPANWWHEKPAVRREAFAHANAWHSAVSRVAGRRPVVVNHVDRGYEPRTVRVEPAHEVRSAVQVHAIPSRPTVSANVGAHISEPGIRANVGVRVSAPGVSVFTGAHSAVETRAASTRGVESRAVATSHPSGGGSRPSGGGGGGGGHPSGGGGGGKR